MRFDNVIGIDAGGSRTRVVIVSREQLEAGKPDGFDKMAFGPTNFSLHGETGVKEILRELSIHSPTGGWQRTFVLSGFAGAGNPDNQMSIIRLLEREGFRRENIVATSDAGLLIMAMGGSGIGLIAGTGSICAGAREIVQGRWGELEVRAGGYGDRIPSECGGYRLGIGAVDAALRIADGRGDIPTVLSRYVREWFDLDDIRSIPSILYPSNEADRGKVTMIVSGLAGIVLRAAYEEDRIACELVEETIVELTDMVLAVLERMGTGITRVGLHGGLFADSHGEDLLVVPLQDRLSKMGHELAYTSFGIEEGDPDILLEALKFVISSPVDPQT